MVWQEIHNMKYETNQYMWSHEHQESYWSSKYEFDLCKDVLKCYIPELKAFLIPNKSKVNSYIAYTDKMMSKGYFIETSGQDAKQRALFLLRALAGVEES